MRESSPALYAGGAFTSAGGVAANRIARWDGSSWSPLGSGIGGSTPLLVDTLAVFDDGSGPALYAAGRFTSAGGVPANDIARWNGSSWSALGGDMDGVVRALLVHDDGGGPALYAGSVFFVAGGVEVGNIAKWNGSSWSTLGSGVHYYVTALVALEDAAGPALCAGGEFFSALDSGDSYVAKWGYPEPDLSSGVLRVRS